MISLQRYNVTVLECSRCGGHYDGLEQHADGELVKWDDAHEIQRQLQDAEAQLATVRAALTGVHVMSSQDAGQVVCATVVEDVLGLLKLDRKPNPA